MKKIAFLAAVACGVTATPALAQDEASDGGFFIGALAGVDSVRISDGADSGSDEGIMYGVTAGYDFATSSGMVLGVEAELADSEVSESASDIFVAGDEFSLSAGRDIYVGVRAGAKIGSGALLYAKGGYTNARVKAAYDDGVDAFSGSDTLDGFRLGAGAEFGFGSGLAARIEYRYSDYGEYSFDGVGTGLSAQRHQGVVTVLTKF